MAASLKITINRRATRGGIQLAADSVADKGARDLIYLARREVANRTKIKTGNLKRNWKVVRKSRENYRLQNSVPYAWYVENGRPGTSFRGYHMLRDGIKAARQKWRAYYAAGGPGPQRRRQHAQGSVLRQIGAPQVSQLGKTYGQPVAGLGAGGGPAPVRIPGINIPRTRVPGF